MAKVMVCRPARLIFSAFFLVFLFLLAAATLAGSDERSRLSYDRGGIVRGPADRKFVALVFSADAYGEGLEYILDELGGRQIKASFFLTGNFLRQPDFGPLVGKMLLAGHYVGPHSGRHLLYCDWQDREKTLVSKEEFLTDLNDNYAELEKFGITREKARYFLPPYEWYNRQIADWASEAGVTIVNFTPGLITTADYTTPDMDNYRSSEEILSQLLNYETTTAGGLNGYIILIHPGVAPARTDLFYFRLGQLLDELLERGYAPVRIDRLLSDETDGAEESLPGREDGDRNQRPVWSGRSNSEDKSRAGQQGEKAAGGQEATFSLTRARVDWIRGKVAGLAVVEDTALLTVESARGLSCRLISTRSGQQLGAISFPPGFGVRIITGQSGFWLVSEGNLLFLNARNGQIIKVSSEIEELPLSGQLASDGRIVLCFRRTVKALDSRTGQTVWEFELPDGAIGSVTVTGKYVFVAVRPGLLIGLDLLQGRVILRRDFKEEIAGLFTDGKRNLFLTTFSGRLVCFDREKARVRWKFNLGRQPVSHLLVQGDHLYLLTPGGIIYKLKASGGDILWWQTVPGWTPFRPAILEDEIVVPGGEILHGFELASGRKSSETVLSFDLKTDLTVAGSLLLAASHDYLQELSLVYSLKKEPGIRIKASRESPQPAGRRIVFTVLTAGWKKPRFEFYLRRGSGRELLVRKASRVNVWTWFPAEAGEYTVGVSVFDRQLSKKAELRYNITSLTGD